MLNKKLAGFTLLEILIALFVFTIVSMIMVSALHSVLTAQAATEKNAERFNQLQLATLFISRDIEQTVDRAVTGADGTQQVALLGSTKEIQFTHAGWSNPFGELTRSTLQRTHYFVKKNILIRETWPQLDITRDTQTSQREILDNVEQIQFEYLDQDNKFQNIWPAGGSANSALPRAVRVTITLKNLGKLSQLYLIPAQPLNTPMGANNGKQ